MVKLRKKSGVLEVRRIIPIISETIIFEQDILPQNPAVEALYQKY